MAEEFVEIREDLSLLRPNYNKTKKVRIPIEICYSLYRKNDTMTFSIMIFFVLSAGFAIREDPRHHHLVANGFCILFSGLLIVGFFRKFMARWQVGGGIAVISAAGFRDSRLSDQIFAWSDFKTARIDTTFKTGNVRGVALKLADGVEAPRTDLAYRRAFLIPRSNDRCIYVELDGVRDARDAARAVQALVLRHQPQT